MRLTRCVANSYIISLKGRDVVEAHTKWINTQVANTNSSWVASMYNAASAKGTSLPIRAERV
jgi:hypothetical protein